MQDLTSRTQVFNSHHDFHNQSHYCQTSKVNILKNMGSHGTLDDVDGRAKLAGRGQLTSGDERVRSEVPERNKKKKHRNQKTMPAGQSHVVMKNKHGEQAIAKIQQVTS